MRSITTAVVSCVAAAWTALPLSAQVGPVELGIWNDPSFKRRFAESFMAETDIEPRVSREEGEAMQRIFRLMADGDVEAAISALEQQRSPAASAVFDFTVGGLYVQRGDFENGARAAQTAVEKHPRFRRAWSTLGLAYVRQQEFEKALGALTRVIELGGGDSGTFGMLGFAYANSGNDVAAESAYRMAMMLDPGTTDWKLRLGLTLLRLERYAEAASMAGTLIKEDPENPDLWIMQANAFIGLDEPLRAAQNYEFIDGLGASSLATLTALADIYINAGLYDMAVSTYIRAIDIDPDHDVTRALEAAGILAYKGATAETGRLFQHIETEYADGLSIDTRKRMLRLRGRLAIAEGKGSAGEIEMLEEVVKLDPLDGEALLLLGEHHRTSGRPEKAILFFTRAANLKTFEADGKLGHGQALVDQRKYAEAVPLLNRAYELDPIETVKQFRDRIALLAKGSR